MGDRIAIDFGTSGTSYAITANPSTPMYVAEGSTVVTDSSGTLQFWVGQGAIYNRNQVVMDNGNSLIGAVTATQAAAAFAAPGVPGKYFVVTTTGQAPGVHGDLYYSIIDMTANGGLGAVTATKNVPLTTGGRANEMLTAVPTSDGLGYWVITAEYGSNNLVAVRFDANGPVGAPVITASLPQTIGDFYGSIYFNAQLTRFVMVSDNRMSTGGTNYVFLMQFNATNGSATELASWPVPANPADAGASGLRDAYAADFSPGGNYVYVSQLTPGRLWRYNVTDLTNIVEEYVGETGDTADITIGGGHVRRGPDGAMWVANLGTSSLTRIPNPDAPSVAGIGFVRGNVPLPAGTQSRWGLPQTAGGCAPAVSPTNLNPGSGQAIPTLGEWALMLLALGLAGVAGLSAKRRA